MKTSPFADKMGKVVAHPEITVVDDGTIAGRRGSLTYDDEGMPSQYTTLIENGRVVSYIHDRMSARYFSVAPTGNGRRESFQHQPMPRMTNTYMLQGTSDPQEIIASTERGIYAREFSGGQVDIATGNFVFVATLLFPIENGVVLFDTPLRQATLTGTGYDVLTHVDMVGTDMALDPGIGTCGKNGQSVPVGVGQPTIRLAEGAVVVGGAA
jgi:TldD protein